MLLDLKNMVVQNDRDIVDDAEVEFFGFSAIDPVAQN
jgi:hypothetical protein